MTKVKPELPEVTPDRKENLARVLADARIEFGINKSQLAKRIKVSQTTISQWTRGLQYPDEDNRKKIAEALGMTFERFEAKILNKSFTAELKTSFIDVSDYLKNCSDQDFYLLMTDTITPRLLNTLHKSLKGQ